MDQESDGRRGKKMCAHRSHTKTALTLIYISRKHCSKGVGGWGEEGRAGLWDALTVRYQQQ